jgi:hypothetical protein
LESVREGRDDGEVASTTEAVASAVHAKPSALATIAADPDILRPRLLAPAPKDEGTTRCYVLRQRFLLAQPIYRLYEESESTLEGGPVVRQCALSQPRDGS